MNEGILRLVSEHTVFLRSEALALGIPDKELTRLRMAGVIHRVRHGTYCLATTWESADARTRRLIQADAVGRRANCEYALSHASALAAYDVPYSDQFDDLVHLTRLDARSGRKEAGVAQHHGWVTAEDVTRRDGRWVTSATRTALDITSMLPTVEALVSVDALLHDQHTTPSLLERRYDSMRMWPNMLRAHLVLHLADGQSESPGETRVRYICWSANLPTPLLQYPIRAGGRVIARLDLAWPELGVWLEFDGQVKYRTPYRVDERPEDVVIREKRREDEIRRITGWTCVRVSWSDLARPQQLIANLRRAFRDQAEVHSAARRSN